MNRQKKKIYSGFEDLWINLKTHVEKFTTFTKITENLKKSCLIL